MLLLSMAAVARQRALCGETRCWPSTWILGCPKCASSSVWDLARGSLGFCGAELVGLLEGEAEWHQKETHFWSGRGVVNASMVPMIGELFTELYPVRRVGKDCAGYAEATPDNLKTAEAPSLLKKAAPKSVSALFRFVVVLREPIARDLSWYNHLRRLSLDLRSQMLDYCEVTGPYEEYARCQAERFEMPVHRAHEKGLWRGIYKPQLDSWARWFDRAQILVLDFDSLVFYNTSTHIRTLATFLGLQADDDNLPTTIPHTNARGNQQTTIDCEVRDLLDAIYAPWNAQLYALLDEDHRIGRAWDGEPPFRPFEPMPCTSA
ncbi:hypothetical protein CTAYLR_009504 [Chrysophaeum taylorii]|uniref:Sulfotransferase domain-containing protein n=1 Tax=Chrysophaeum taylorii TaxID=2483200 RepID=A0AAD7U4D3_9STRA|nr:hypothetical protein CTAYLR_009504 [Chrysophaeum taylorii]